VSNSKKSSLLLILGRTARTQVYPQAEGDTWPFVAVVLLRC
jgi:hypothetical protein